jgi:hypothetical protein
MNNAKNDYIHALISAEWDMFQKVNHIHGRAACQDDPNTFALMRKSQWLIYPPGLLAALLDWLITAQTNGRNLVWEKYARMMEHTEPEHFQKIRTALPNPSPRSRELAHSITKHFVRWELAFLEAYPCFVGSGRPVRSSKDRPGSISTETYLYAELLTYSEHCLELWSTFVKEAFAARMNLAEATYREMLPLYGYASLKEYVESQKQESDKHLII